MSISTVLAMSPETRTGLGAVALAAGCAFVVGLLAVLAVQFQARRNAAAASWLAPIAVVATVAVGVIVSAWAMVLESSQVATMAAVLLVTASIATAFGFILAREVRRAEGRHAAAREQWQRAAVVEAQRQLLISWLSHDLRTPLARMKAITEALGDGLAPDPERYLAQLGTEVDGLAHLVDDLLALSRLTSDETPLRREPIDVSDALSDAVARAAPQAQTGRVRLLGGAESGIILDADPQDLHRALANLLDNAIRHTPAGGTVEVGGRRRGSRALIEVADECGGIPAATMASMFEPGWYDDTARSPTSGTRTGLGLAIVQHFVARHGGTVSASNRGNGCAFTVDLPLA